MGWLGGMNLSLVAFGGPTAKVSWPFTWRSEIASGPGLDAGGKWGWQSETGDGGLMQEKNAPSSSSSQRGGATMSTGAAPSASRIAPTHAETPGWALSPEAAQTPTG